MAVSAVGTSTGLVGTSATTQASTGLDSTTFMNMFTTELANQDPMNPMSSADFLNQIAQITSVQTMSELQTTLGNMSTQQAAQTASNQLTQAEGLIGRAITYVDSSGNAQQGVVQAIRINPDGSIKLALPGDTLVGLDALSQVQ